MARLPRLYAPHTPQLVQAEFARPLAAALDPEPAAQFDQLLAWLRTGAAEHQARVHGWVLLRDRVALLATAPDADTISRVMQGLGRRFAARFRHGRVFAGRYRSALVEPGGWVLPALVWLDNLPVRQGCVDRAEHWPWSSARSHCGLAADPADWIANHSDYWEDGNTPFDRQASYRRRLAGGLSPEQEERIERSLFGQWALGDAAFMARMASMANRRPAPAARGRPRKEAPTP